MSRIFACFFLFLRENEKSLTDIVKADEQHLAHYKRNIVTQNLTCRGKKHFYNGLSDAVSQKAAYTNVDYEFYNISLRAVFIVKGETLVKHVAEDTAKEIIGTHRYPIVQSEKV